MASIIRSEWLDPVALMAWVQKMEEEEEISPGAADRLSARIWECQGRDPRGVNVRVIRTGAPAPTDIRNETDPCGELVPGEGQNRCTRNAGHDGDHRCKATDVDARLP